MSDETATATATDSAPAAAPAGKVAAADISRKEIEEFIIGLAKSQELYTMTPKVLRRSIEAKFSVVPHGMDTRSKEIAAILEKVLADEEGDHDDAPSPPPAKKETKAKAKPKVTATKTKNGDGEEKKKRAPAKKRKNDDIVDDDDDDDGGDGSGDGSASDVGSEDDYSDDDKPKKKKAKAAPKAAAASKSGGSEDSYLEKLKDIARANLVNVRTLKLNTLSDAAATKKLENYLESKEIDYKTQSKWTKSKLSSLKKKSEMEKELKELQASTPNDVPAGRRTRQRQVSYKDFNPLAGLDEFESEEEEEEQEESASDAAGSESEDD